MKKFLLLLLTAALIFSCSKDKDETTDKSADPVYMGTNAEFPPFEFKGGETGNEVIGFDAEIAKEIAKTLGRDLEIKDMKFDGLIPALISGKIDFAAAGMTITEQRAKNVDFSDPYYEATQSVIIKGDSIASKADLKNKIIAVQLGTSGENVARDMSENVKAFNSGFEAIMELKTGRADAVIIDIQPAKVFLAKNPDLKQAPIEFESEFYGIAVKKGNKELLDAINKTLKALKESGRFNELIEEFMK